MGHLTGLRGLGEEPCSSPIQIQLNMQKRQNRPQASAVGHTTRNRAYSIGENRQVKVLFMALRPNDAADRAKNWHGDCY